MKNNFFVYALTAFCLFSLQTINTSDKEKKDKEKKDLIERADLYKTVETEKKDLYGEALAESMRLYNPLEVQKKNFKERDTLYTEARKTINSSFEKTSKENKNFYDAFKEQMKLQEEIELRDAIINNDEKTIIRIVKRKPWIVGEMVPGLKKTYFRDWAVLYNSVPFMQTINEELNFNPNLIPEVMAKFRLDFEFDINLKSIPLDAGVILNLSPDMIQQIMRWNSFSQVSYYDTPAGIKRRHSEYFNVNVPALLKSKRFQNMDPNEDSLPKELQKAEAYTRLIVKTCAQLIDGSKPFDPKNFPWIKRNMPIKSMSIDRIDSQYPAYRVPRLRLLPVLNLEELGNLRKKLDIEEDRRIDQEGREILEAEIKERDQIAEALRKDKEARRLQEAYRLQEIARSLVEAQRIVEAQKNVDFQDRSLPSPYHNHTKRIG